MTRNVNMKIYSLFLSSTYTFGKVSNKINIYSNYIPQRSHFLSTQRSKEIKKYLIDYDMYFDINLVTRCSSQTTLKSLLRLPTEVVKNYIKQYPNLKTIPPKNLLTRYQILINKNVKKSTIIKHVNVLTQDTEILLQKLLLIEQYGFDLNISLPFVYLSVQEIINFHKNCNRQQITPLYKVQTISELLQEDIYNIILIFCKYKCLRTQPLTILQEKIQIFLDYKITTQNILRNLRLLSCSVKILKSKLSIINEIPITNRKKNTYLCPTESLGRNDDTLPNNIKKTIEYLEKKINCDKLLIEYIILNKDPKLSVKPIEEYKKIFDLFDEFKIDKTRLLISYSLFHKNVDVLKSRLEKVKDSGISISRMLFMLSLPDEKFDQKIKQKLS